MLISLILLLTGALTLAASLGLWLAHAGFWVIERDPVPPPPAEWPPVSVVIPARNEEAVIGETLRSLCSQDYPGRITILVVDDESEDGTSAAAQRVGDAMGAADIRVAAATPRPPGWTGKVWAMDQGVSRVAAEGPLAPYVLFSDADISHGHGALRELVSRAEAGGLDLASFMVRLECRSAAERLMIPGFVFFFRMLYPFRRVNDPKDTLAGAAGGTMLLRREALDRIGGLTSIRGQLIDDCSLAHEVKRGGHRLWLAMNETSRSTRGYETLGEIVRMIARTAYTQLGYSPIRLLGCVLGLALVFLAPPLLLLSGFTWATLLGLAAWLIQTRLFLPTVRFYGQSPLWAPLLPVTATLYVWATVVSAWQHHRGRGGAWKGRSQSGEVTRREV